MKKKKKDLEERERRKREGERETDRERKWAVGKIPTKWHNHKFSRLQKMTENKN